MALKFSIGLVNALAATSSYKAALEGGAGFLIDIYSGSRPGDPNDPPSGTKLVTISLGGTGDGMSFENAAPTDALLKKKASETWSGTVIANGVATWYRLRKTTDAGASSTTETRIDGTVGTSGADINLTSTNMVTGAPFTVSSYAIELTRGL